MVTRLTVQLDTDVLDAINVAATEAPARMKRAAGLIARGPRAQQVVHELAVEPGKPTYPIQWTSERQRRAFFATKGFGRGIPYVRTHKQSQGWSSVLEDLESGDLGGVISFTNANRASEFIQGERQQGYLSKWPLARLVVRDHENELQDALIDAWYGVVTGGIK